jgi:hypothetical protein
VAEALDAPNGEFSVLTGTPRVLGKIASAEARLTSELERFFRRLRVPGIKQFRHRLPETGDIVPMFQSCAEEILSALVEDELGKIDSSMAVEVYRKRFREIVGQVVQITCAKKGFWSRVVLVSAGRANFFGRFLLDDDEFEARDVAQPPPSFARSLRAALLSRLAHWEAQAWDRAANAPSVESPVPEIPNESRATSLTAQQTRAEFIRGVKNFLKTKRAGVSVEKFVKDNLTNETFYYALGRAEGKRFSQDNLNEFCKRLGCAPESLYRAEYDKKHVSYRKELDVVPSHPVKHPVSKS